MKNMAIAVAVGLCCASPAVASVFEKEAVQEVVRELTVKPVSGGIEISSLGNEPSRVSVYSITGQLVKTVEVYQGSVVVELPRGLYIVKSPEGSRQIVVK